MTKSESAIHLLPVNLLSRREFLRRLGRLAGAACAGTLLGDLSAIAQPRKSLHVVIIGAGLAGLCAAFELEQRGHSVTILEADPVHIGGRVRTVRFEGGLYGEVGAMRIPLRHDLTRRYITEFKLPLRRFVQSNPEGFYFIRGRRERIKEVKRIGRLFALRGAERDKSPDDLWDEVVSRRVATLSDGEKTDLFAESPVTDAVARLDRQSLRQLCAAAGLSPEATEYLMVTSGEESIMHSAITEDIREEILQIWTQEFHEIVGGNDRLPAAFAARLKSGPRMRCEVIRLEQDPERKRAAAIYRDGTNSGKLTRVEGDFILCTLPFPVLNRLTVDQPFSSGKQRAIRQLNYESATKELLVAQRRFWEKDDGIYGGSSYTDLPTGITCYPSDNAARDPLVSAGPGVMLASYTWGQAARRLAALPDRARSEQVSSQLSRLHPQLRESGMVRESAGWSWDTHRWSGGAFAWFMPGQHLELHREVVKPEGQIFFAGEHTTLTHAWMQGALESALRGVREILSEKG